jgi:glycosyltransferase involved in cell wall biosynthesis
MRPVRVSFVADTESWGGAEVWVAHHLRRATDHGVEASVVCAEQVADRFRSLVTEDRLAVVPLARHAVSAPAIEAALLGQSPDVVHVNLVDPASNAASIAAALATAPATATLHLPGDSGDVDLRARLAGLFGELSVLLTASEEAAGQVRTDLAEPRGGVVVGCNGVDVPLHPHGPAGRWPPRVGVHARLTRQKGIDVLLEAVARVVEAGLPVDVVVGGTGRDEATLRGAAAGLPVRFVGWVPAPRDFLAGLDVFCLPSRAEALPLALLEAMAEGLPCVATDVGDVRRRVGNAVRVVPAEDPVALADALAGLLADPPGRAALGARARLCAQRYHDAGDMVARTYHLLRAAARPTAATAAS